MKYHYLLGHGPLLQYAIYSSYQRRLHNDQFSEGMFTAVVGSTLHGFEAKR